MLDEFTVFPDIKQCTAGDCFRLQNQGFALLLYGNSNESLV